MGWFARIEQPLVRDASLAVWRWFSDLDLSEAKRPRFASLHDCFTRELRPGARPIDSDSRVLISPSDGIVGACGQVADGMLFQAKGYPYRIDELIPDARLAAAFARATYATLRLTASMYHRFHAPHDAAQSGAIYVSGDTWNVNPVALARVERLFCRNERVLLPLTLAASGDEILLVAVAAILVAGVRLHAADVTMNLRYRGPNRIPCAAAYAKGEEIGWFEHGSTIIVFAPPDYALAEGVAPGRRVRMGEALLRLPAGRAVRPPARPA
ncbi:MAG: phosphatidylserine decarboxylase [Burkholderiales bacterium]|nr:phosphatidylserine decarboxylase [Burkholderiales bacterium]